MGINRIDGPSNAGGLPDPQRIGATKKESAGGPTFGEVLAAQTAPDLRAELADAEVVNRLLAVAQDPAALAVAMSIVMSWEMGRREAVRVEMDRRRQEAGMDKLLAEFAKRATTVPDVSGAAGATVEGHVSVDRIALEIAMRLRLQQAAERPKDDTEEKK